LDYAAFAVHPRGSGVSRLGQLATYVWKDAIQRRDARSGSSPWRRCAVIEKPIMSYYYDAAMLWIGGKLDVCWTWFNSLSRPEWLAVLATVTLLGLLCMRGYGSRTNY
jgi:hypothetical protein